VAARLFQRDRAHITATLEALVDWLKRYPIDDDSGIMYTMLYPILKSHTLPFLHELRMFAVSPFSMEEYDALVVIPASCMHIHSFTVLCNTAAPALNWNLCGIRRF
jgi:hypothetical protein